MANKETTPDAIDVEKTGSKLPDVGGMAGGVGQNVKNVTDMVMDAEKRKQFLTSEDMEPHRMLVILLGLTVLITIIVALVF